MDIQIKTKSGIDYCSGSLGHGISVGCGVALSYLKDKKKNNVFVLMGDGEVMKEWYGGSSFLL